MPRNEYKGDTFFYPKIHSSVQDKGKTVTQTITFIGGHKKTIKGIQTASIVPGEFTHFNTEDGRKVMINTPNVLYVEIFAE